MKSAAKKRRADQGAAWSDESEASVMFYKQGERNAAEEVLAYQQQVSQSQTAQRRKRGWLLLGLAMLVALAAGVAAAHYLGSI